jgi:hypothetical protein
VTRIATDAHEQTAMSAWASAVWPLSLPVRAADSLFHDFLPSVKNGSRAPPWAQGPGALSRSHRSDHYIP